MQIARPVSIGLIFVHSLLFISVLSGCKSDYRVVTFGDGLEDSSVPRSIFRQGERHRAWVMNVSVGTPFQRAVHETTRHQLLVFEPPPWRDSKARQLMRSRQSWQNLGIDYGNETGLADVAGFAFDETFLSRPTWIISIDPLVLAAGDSKTGCLSASDGTWQRFVLVVRDKDLDCPISTLIMLAGDYPRGNLSLLDRIARKKFRDRLIIQEFDPPINLSTLLEKPSIFLELGN